MTGAEIVAAADTAASILKVLAPAAEQVVAWFKGGPEPTFFTGYPSELKSVAALERARYRAAHKMEP